jgi:MFS family permease
MNMIAFGDLVLSNLTEAPADLSTLAPLKRPWFLILSLCILASNLGAMIQTVGASWLMGQIQSSPAVVALVQTAASLPLFLFALPAGAAGDLFDRRIVLFVAQLIASLGAVLLCILTSLHWITPVSLLILTFVVGSSLAIRAPVWQTSIGELVPRTEIPAGVALNALSYNAARCVGPALGGVIVHIAGSAMAFGVNAVSYVPFLIALSRWRPQAVAQDHAAKSLGTAVVSGVRYVATSPPMIATIARGCAIGFGGGALWGLLPLVARDQIGGGSTVYGLLLAAFGLGAIFGSAWSNLAFRTLGVEWTWRGAATGFALGSVVLGLSRSVWPASAALFVAGAAWPIVLSTLTVIAQIEAPREFVGRAVGAWQSAAFGSLAIGGAVWGQVAARTTVGTALVSAGLCLAVLMVCLVRLPVDITTPPPD